MIPPRHYTIESSGKRQLYLTWNAFTWKNFEIRLDGKQIAFIKNGAGELKDGRQFRLPGGARLNVQIKRNYLLKDVHILINDKPIPNTPSDPDVKIRRAANALFFMGAFDVIMGLWAARSGSLALTSLGFGWTTVAIGMVMFSLALLVRKASLIALALGIGLYLIDTFLGFYVTSLGGTGSELGIFIARFLLLASMIPAIPAIRSNKTGTG